MREDNDAVSSVISVVLLVAVVVVLGTVVSVVALDIGEDVESTAPTTDFEFEVLDNGDLQVTHANGETLNGDQVRFTSAALEKSSFGGVSEWSGDSVEAGDSAAVNVKGGETLRLVWRSTESDLTATLAEYEVPSDVNPEASIGSVDTGYYTWISGDVTVSNIQFSQVENDRVYVVVEDEPSVGNGDGTTSKQYFSTDGGDLTVDLTSYYISDDETITVTVYETGSESKMLATATAPA